MAAGAVPYPFAGVFALGIACGAVDAVWRSMVVGRALTTITEVVLVGAAIAWAARGAWRLVLAPPVRTRYSPGQSISGLIVAYAAGATVIVGMRLLTASSVDEGRVMVRDLFVVVGLVSVVQGRARSTTRERFLPLVPVSLLAMLLGMVSAHRGEAFGGTSTSVVMSGSRLTEMSWVDPPVLALAVALLPLVVLPPVSGRWWTNFAVGGAVTALGLSLLATGYFGSHAASAYRQLSNQSNSMHLKAARIPTDDGVPYAHVSVRPPCSITVYDARSRPQGAPTPRSGEHAAAFTTYDTCAGVNVRSQVQTAALFKPGDDVFVGWSTYFPEDFPEIHDGHGGYFVFMSSFGPPYTGSSNNAMGVYTESDGVTYLERRYRDGHQLWKRPLPRGRWIDFVRHIRFSKDAHVGFDELWVDGVKQIYKPASGTPLVSRTRHGQRLLVDTMDLDATGNYEIRLTNYRQRGQIPGAVTIYQDGIRIGDSYADVAPEPRGESKS